jgi:hypothetical protein
MNDRKILIFGFLIICSSHCAISQEYNEQKTREQIEKFNNNPKLYYDKIKSLTSKLEEANQNTLKVSEEYLALLDKKDSVINIYKSQLSKARASSGPAKSLSAPSAAPAVQAPIEQKKDVLNESPYRVQLAAFKREDFVNFFTKSTKTFGVQKLDNRSVMEIQGFNTHEEAHEFSQKMRALGFPGAFVTRYEGGVRQDNRNYLAKSGLKTAATTPTKMTDAYTKEGGELDYPNYIPLGYKELMGDRSKQMLQAAMTPPALRNIPQPLTKFSSNQTDIDKSGALLEGSSMPASIPKTAAKPKVSGGQNKSNTGNAKTASGKKQPPAEEPAPPAKQGDQLDQAFDQLFKK